MQVIVRKYQADNKPIFLLHCQYIGALLSIFNRHKTTVYDHDKNFYT